MPFRFNTLGIDYKAVFRGANARLLIGQVRSVNKSDNSRTVGCVKMSLDPKLLKYWNYRKMFRADDITGTSGEGDIVVISQLQTPKGHLITHKITEVLYKQGAVIDPMSGQLCHGVDYHHQSNNSNYIRYKQGHDTEL